MRRIVLFALASLSLLLLAGCGGGGYRSYTPNDRQDYDAFLEPQHGAAWRWVRGRSIGQIDDDPEPEQIVLATYQPGSRSAPGDIEELHLLVLDNDGSADLELRWKRIAFDRTERSREAFPTRVHLTMDSVPAYRHCSAQVRNIDRSDRNLILVSLWTDEEEDPIYVTHIGYRIAEDEASLREVFRSTTLQLRPRLDTTDLDGDQVSEILLECRIPPAPPGSAAPTPPPPTWITVYRMDGDGRYREADFACERCYADLELPWLRSYVQAMHSDLPDESAAVYEYYLGLIYLFQGDAALARDFFESALAMDHSGRLREVADRALAEARTLDVEGQAEANAP